MKLLTALFVAAVVATPAAATTLRISITNDRAENGFALTPIYSAFHDGTFDTYTPGESADGFGGLEELAELGDFGPVRDRRIEEQDTSAASLLSGFTGENNRRPLFGGESDSFEIDITDTTSQRYFSFLSMIVPTNDLFVGNGNPLAFELFDEMGLFTGDRTITLTGANIRDAGTEVNNAGVGVAFAAGQDATAGDAENGVVTDGFDQLAQFLGLETVGGFTVDDDGAFGFASDFALATITIEAVADVAPIPLPAGAVLMLTAMGAFGISARRRTKKAAA